MNTDHLKVELLLFKDSTIGFDQINDDAIYEFVCGQSNVDKVFPYWVKDVADAISGIRHATLLYGEVLGNVEKDAQTALYGILRAYVNEHSEQLKPWFIKWGEFMVLHW
ncbi:MAG: hypothetical protein IT564_11445 [Rhodospirillales bacterium]|nr:hypothetical protein [Rhodospirillales bacterium]